MTDADLDSITWPTDSRYAAETLRSAALRMRESGHPDVAESLTNLLLVANGYNNAMGRTDEVPGWNAAVFLAGRIADQGPKPGDRVAVTYPDGTTVTGEWGYDGPSADEPLGSPYVVRDDDGDRERHVTGAVHVEITRLANRVYGWDVPLGQAATVLRSAWTPGEDFPDEPEACHGCGREAQTGALACTHSTSCTCRACLIKTHEYSRWCGMCGQATRYRAVAWVPVPQFGVEVGLDDAEVEHFTPPLELWHPQEVAAAYVCSAPCTHQWVQKASVGLVETIPAREVAHVKFRIEAYRYAPGRHDLPRPMWNAYMAARTVAHAVDAMATTWVNAAPSTSHRTSTASTYYLDQGKEAVARLVDALVQINATGREVWPESRFDLGAPSVIQDGDSELGRAVRLDPVRYQVGERVVFDRVEQVYRCPRCQDEGSYEDQGGPVDQPLVCESCDHRLLP